MQDDEFKEQEPEEQVHVSRYRNFEVVSGNGDLKWKSHLDFECSGLELVWKPKLTKNEPKV